MVEVTVEVTVEPVVPLKPVEGVQLYVVPPEAVSVAVPPEHIVGELTVIVGVGLTVTVDVAVAEHPLLVPVTV